MTGLRTTSGARRPPLAGTVRRWAGLVLAAIALATAAPAQDLDPSGGTYKPPVSPRHRERRPPARQQTGHPGPRAHVDPPPHVRPAEALRHYELGNAAYDRNELEKAVAEYDAAIKLDPKYVDALIELGAAYYDLSDLDAALDAWARALFLDKTIPELHNDIANVNYVRRDYEKATAEYNEAIRLRPGYYDALFGLGNTLVALRRFDEAVPYFEKAIDARGTPFPEARTNMVWAMLRAGQREKAETSARQAIDEIGPDSQQAIKAWYALAAVLSEKQDLAGAADALRKAIAVCAECLPEQVSRVYYSLARVLEAKGDRTGAADALERYLNLAPYVTNAEDVRRKIVLLRSS